MKVVIVAKTRMGSGACIGGLTFEGRSVRLAAADADTNDHFNMEYAIGDVWDVDYRADENLLPPHTENIVVTGKRKLPPIDDVAAFAERHMPPVQGGVEALYEGLTQSTKAGALYITGRTGIPAYSTMFWRPNQPLVRDDDAKRIRYRYPTDDGGRTLTFVGFQEPLEMIPAGVLLRVSLAHWWRPQEMPGGELRCYVQLSGWFAPAPAFNGSFIDWPEDISMVEPVIVPQSEPFRPDIDNAAPIMKQVFGYETFRPLQEEIVGNVLNKRDSLAVMPTGSGKSLCYQLPALLFSGLTVVVSPLISLMEDQVTGLKELGVAAAYLNSTLSYEEYGRRTAQVRAGVIKLLYAAPETLLRPETLLLLEGCPVECLTIDEAHCISEWGHDFRPEYRQLVEVRRRLPAAVCLAVTATATERVREDIKASLGIADADEFLASFNRENLLLAVASRVDGLAQTLAFLADHRGETGIIYCATRKQVDDLAARLAERGWPVLPYHAGLDNATRRRHQRQFSYEDAVIIVATIAFGMGIDKPEVRFILHYDLPKNLENYYQQVGRAGRDGLPAGCLLLFSQSDVLTVNYFIDQQAPGQRPGAKARLEAMLAYAETSHCRRRPLLAYFGEEFSQAKCGMCDNCRLEERDLVDLTVPAQKFFSCVRRTGEIYGASHIIDVLRGSRSQKVLARKHDRLSTYNIGLEFSKKEWQILARQLVQQGYLNQDMEHGSLRLTAKAYDVFKGETVMGVRPEEPGRPAAQVRAALVYDQALFELLRAKRRELAQAQGLPPYIIFTDATLVEMATYYPQSAQTLTTMTGVGHVKLEKYGHAFLAVIKDYCHERGIAEKPKQVAYQAERRSSRQKNRAEEVLDAYNSGRAVTDIAADYGVIEKTVLSHLWKAVQAGRSLRPGDFLQGSTLSDTEHQRALAAFDELGVERLRPVYEVLGETIGYDELHRLRLHFVSNLRQGDDARK